MSEPTGPFAPIHRMMNKMLHDGGVYSLNAKFREKYGLDQTLDDARRAARGLPPSDEARVTRALDELKDAVKSAEAKGDRQYRVGLAVGITGLGLGVLGIVVSLLIAACSAS